METRYIGGLVVTIDSTGVNGEGRWRYVGTVKTPTGRAWDFDDLRTGVGGYRGVDAPDAPEAFDRAAVEACAFAAYYTTDNRDDDAPEWAPPAKVADEIEDELLCALASDHSESENHYWVQRELNGEEHGPYA